MDNDHSLDYLSDDEEIFDFEMPIDDFQNKDNSSDIIESSAEILSETESDRVSPRLEILPNSDSVKSETLTSVFPISSKKKDRVGPIGLDLSSGIFLENIRKDFHGFDMQESERCILNLETGDMIKLGPGAKIEDGRDETFYRELSNMVLDETVKQKAIEIFFKMNLANVSIKGNNRIMCKFACIYYAYEELNRPIDPRTVANLVNLKLGQINRAISTFSEAQTGYAPVKRETTATQLIPELMRKLGIMNGYEDAQQFSDRILAKNEKVRQINPKRECLQNMFPQNVAAAILLYYLQIHGREININTYPDIVGKKRATIETIYKEVLESDR